MQSELLFLQQDPLSIKHCSLLSSQKAREQMQHKIIIQLNMT